MFYFFLFAICVYVDYVLECEFELGSIAAWRTSTRHPMGEVEVELEVELELEFVRCGKFFWSSRMRWYGGLTLLNGGAQANLFTRMLDAIEEFLCVSKTCDWGLIFETDWP